MNILIHGVGGFGIDHFINTSLALNLLLPAVLAIAGVVVVLFVASGK